VCRLGRRVYRDQLHLLENEGARRRYRIYGDDPDYEREEGTDFAAIADGCIAVTPLHFDLTDEAGIESLGEFDLAGLLRPAAREVE
jgi:5'-nucleotidase